MLSAGLGTIFWTSVAFLSVLFLLKKMAWGPILKSLKEREDFIADSIKSAENANEQLSLMKADNEKLLAEARAEREKILKEARDMGEDIVAKAKKVSVEEQQRIMAKAKEEIENEKTAAIAELKTQVVSLSIQMAETLLKKEFENKEQQSKLVEDNLKTAALN
ncbi:MAG: F0F1 ATP synthase subunit B [Flavobacteriales bacterium]|nr:F0F1 ATP synthase subunit B [Flavobacteriales bacterium]